MAEKRVVLEWSIENFSCWNLYVHGNVINCRLLGCESYIAQLYPRGVGGSDEHLEMILRGNDLDGELSFNGLDGFFVRSTPIKFNNSLTLPDFSDKRVKGPKFEEISDKMKRREGVLKIRYLTSANDWPFVSHVRTVIDVFDTSLKINNETFKDCDLKTDTWYLLSTIEYPPTDERRRRFELYFRETRSRSKNKSIDFKVYPTVLEKTTLVKLLISTINSYGQVREHEEGENLFTTSENWINMNSVPKDKNGYHAVIGLKIVPGSFQNYMQSTERQYKISTGTWEDLCAQEKNFKPVISSQSDNSVEALTKNLMCLYQDQDFSDITLKCDSVTFPVHKNILSARSPVFKTMLSSDMKEAASSTVDIGDLDPSTLGLFLTYLYTGGVEDLQGESAIKLYYAADKYQVPSLKSHCVTVLTTEVSVLNVCDVLSLADRHGDQELTTVAQDFILKNFQTVMSSENWERLLKNDPVLVAKTLTQFAQKKLLGAVSPYRGQFGTQVTWTPF